MSVRPRLIGAEEEEEEKQKRRRSIVSVISASAGQKRWALSDVMISVSVRGVSFHVVSVYEALDSFLQIGRFDREFELLVEFGDEEIVRQRLPHLHDAHNRSVDLVLTILGKLINE